MRAGSARTRRFTICVCASAVLAGRNAPFYRRPSNETEGDTVTIYKLGETAPTIHESVFVADTAAIIGKVVLDENASVWFGATIRGDN